MLDTIDTVIRTFLTFIVTCLTRVPVPTQTQPPVCVSVPFVQTDRQHGVPFEGGMYTVDINVMIYYNGFEPLSVGMQNIYANIFGWNYCKCSMLRTIVNLGNRFNALVCGVKMIILQHFHL